MNPKKIYLIDTGFSVLATDFSENRGKLLENAVAVELFRRRRECFYFKGRQECDIVVRGGTKPEAAVQVCWELTTRNEGRELQGLSEAVRELDIREWYILTADEEGERTHDGTKIPVLPVWKWALR
jgi:predicted AAA+ superfamily ATPase